MNEVARSILIGTTGITVSALVALAVAFSREFTGSDQQLRSTRRIASVFIMMQTVHFLEELATGFHHRFPELFGLAPWPTSFFVVFNLFWLVVWAGSVVALPKRVRVVFFPLWFLAIAGMLNGIAHPLLSLRVGGYFPGLFTSPAIGVAGLLLTRRLLQGSARPGR